LIERPPVKDGFAIQGEAPMSVGAFLASDLAQADIGLHRVGADVDLEVIESGGNLGSIV
jgi:hypothetical protein